MDYCTVFDYIRFGISDREIAFVVLESDVNTCASRLDNVGIPAIIKLNRIRNSRYHIRAFSHHLNKHLVITDICCIWKIVIDTKLHVFHQFDSVQSRFKWLINIIQSVIQMHIRVFRLKLYGKNSMIWYCMCFKQESRIIIQYRH